MLYEVITIPESRDERQAERLDCKSGEGRKRSHKACSERNLSFRAYEAKVLGIVHYHAQHETPNYVYGQDSKLPFP